MSAIEAVLPRVWRLVRAGFVLRGPPMMRVLGVTETDKAEAMVGEIVARALGPGGKQIDPAKLDASARAILEAHARLHGGEISIDALPENLVVLDDAERGDPLDPPLDLDARARADIISTVTAEQIATLGPDDRAIIAERAKGTPRAAAAVTLKIAGPKISAREAVIRRRIRHALLARSVRAGHAEIDAALRGDPTALTLAQPTLERLLHAVTTRVDPSPIRSPGVRTAWAIGALALGCGLLALMQADVLPSPSDNPRGEARIEVRCKAACGPGAELDVHIAAPRGMRRVAIALVDARGETTWIADPMGRSVAVPFASQKGLAAIGRDARAPSGTPDRALAVYSKKTLSKNALGRIAAGGPAGKDVLAVWSKWSFE